MSFSLLLFQSYFNLIKSCSFHKENPGKTFFSFYSRKFIRTLENFVVLILFSNGDERGLLSCDALAEFQTKASSHPKENIKR